MPHQNRRGTVRESTILLIEDNEDNAAIYTAFLEHFGHRVIRAADGAEGVRLARETDPNLILLDISLPLLSGWEVAEIVRREERTTRIPILVCTAHDTAEDRAQAMRLGCEAYLTKPCPPRMLLAEVERWLELSTVPASSPETAEAEVEEPSVQARPWAAHVVVLSLGLAVTATVVRMGAGLHARRRRSVAGLSFPRFFGLPSRWAWGAE